MARSFRDCSIGVDVSDFTEVPVSGKQSILAFLKPAAGASSSAGHGGGSSGGAVTPVADTVPAEPAHAAPVEQVVDLCSDDGSSSGSDHRDRLDLAIASDSDPEDAIPPLPVMAVASSRATAGLPRHGRLEARSEDDDAPFVCVPADSGHRFEARRGGQGNSSTVNARCTTDYMTTALMTHPSSESFPRGLGQGSVLGHGVKRFRDASLDCARGDGDSGGGGGGGVITPRGRAADNGSRKGTLDSFVLRGK